MADLDKIYIRAAVDNRWGSFSLQELFDMGKGGMVFEWAISKLNGMEEVNITPQGLSKLVDAMESLGIVIAKVI